MESGSASKNYQNYQNYREPLFFIFSR